MLYVLLPMCVLFHKIENNIKMQCYQRRNDKATKISLI